MFPSGSSVNRRPPWLLTGFRGSVSLLSGATMRALRLPLSISTASLRSAINTSWCLTGLLTPAAKSVLVCQVVVLPVSTLFWFRRRGDRRISQVPREPFSHICPTLRLRPDPCARLLTLWCCSRGHKNEISSNLNISRLNHTAFVLAAYA